MRVEGPLSGTTPASKRPGAPGFRADVRKAIVIAGAIALLGAQPAFAQFDIVGAWGPPAAPSGIFGFFEDNPERQDGPELVDFLGLPFNEAGRARALSYDGSLLTVPEHQCMPHPSMYSYWGPAGLRISADLDDSLALVAYHIGGTFRRADRTIYMDGRAHPPEYAPHTWAGFTTGRWVGTTLVTETTHLKWGWIKRNGSVTSDQATVTTFYNRHGNVMTIMVVVHDPLYLTEPDVKTIDFVAAPANAPVPFGGAGFGASTFFKCFGSEEIAREEHFVPHYLPWANPFTREFADRWHLPADAALGGAETALPEFMWKYERRPAQQPTQGPGQRRQTPPPSAPALRPGEPPASGEIHSWKVQGNVWMLVGGGANVAMQVGDEGVLLVDTGAPGMTDRLLAAIRQITDKPIRYVINTSATADHVGGNEIIAGLPGGSTTKVGSGPTSATIAHENVLNRMTSEQNGRTAYPHDAWPTDAYFSKERDIYFNDEAIEIIHAPSAHSDGDSIVHFRKSDVIVAGDLFTTTNFPLVDATRGGSYQGVLNALNKMIDIAVTKDIQEGGTYVIPGHGRVCDEADLVEVRDQVHMIRDRFADLVVKKNMTLDQVKAMKPIIDFQARYTTPEWTTDMFIETLYQEMSKARTPAAGKPARTTR